MNWLTPVRAALDDVAAPCPIFFRDDDAGWEDARLFAMLDRFDRHGLPVDVAVIPTALTPNLETELTVRARCAGVRLHQHGLAHTNHEISGRKYEFGPSRDASAQAKDVAAGRRLMLDAFGALLDPVFTPPWNRCVPETGGILVDQGFRVLSRDVTAPALDRSDLVEIPVTIDWFGHKKGVRWTPEQLAGRLVDGLSGGGPVGLMLHHAVTDDSETAAVEALLALVAAHPGASPTTIADLAAPIARSALP